MKLKAGDYARAVGAYHHDEVGRIVYVSMIHNEVVIDFPGAKDTVFNPDELISYYEIEELP